jgi:hypothetical protein
VYGWAAYDYSWYKIKYSKVRDEYKLFCGGDHPEKKKSFKDALNKLLEIKNHNTILKKKRKLIEL